MARFNFIAINSSGVDLVAATAKTLLQIVSATNQRVAIKEIGISFNGQVNTSEPVKVDLLMQSTAGTSNALTLGKENDSVAETLQTTARDTITAEPTAVSGGVLRSWYIHPQAGQVFQLPIGDEIIIGGGKRIGLRVTSPTVVKAIGYLRGEE